MSGRDRRPFKGHPRGPLEPPFKSTPLSGIQEVEEKQAKSQASQVQQSHQPISGEFKNLVQQHILNQNRTQVEVAKMFGILDWQVWRIINQARNGNNNPSTSSRGAKSKLDQDLIASTLMHLEENPLSRLKDLENHIKEKFAITISVPLVQKLLKSLNITWRMVMPVPCKWNESSFLQQ